MAATCKVRYLVVIFIQLPIFFPSVTASFASHPSYRARLFFCVCVSAADHTTITTTTITTTTTRSLCLGCTAPKRKNFQKIRWTPVRTPGVWGSFIYIYHYVYWYVLYVVELWYGLPTFSEALHLGGSTIPLPHTTASRKMYLVSLSFCTVRRTHKILRMGYRITFVNNTSGPNSLGRFDI